MMQSQRVLKVGKSAVTCLALDCDQKHCVLSMTDGRVVIYSLPAMVSGDLVCQGEIHSMQIVRCLHWGNHSTRDSWVAGEDNGTLFFARVQKLAWQNVLTLPLHAGDILDMSWKEEYLVTASVDNSISILRVQVVTEVLQPVIVTRVTTDLGWVSGLTYFQNRLYVQVTSSQHAVGHLSVYEADTKSLQPLLRFLYEDEDARIISKPVSGDSYICFAMESTAPDIRSFSVVLYWPGSTKLLEIPVPMETGYISCCLPVSKDVFVGTDMGLLLFSASDQTSPWRQVVLPTSSEVTCLIRHCSHLLIGHDAGEVTLLPLHSS